MDSLLESALNAAALRPEQGTVANWRALRRECRNALPKDDRKELQENGE